VLPSWRSFGSGTRKARAGLRIAQGFFARGGLRRIAVKPAGPRRVRASDGRARLAEDAAPDAASKEDCMTDATRRQLLPWSAAIAILAAAPRAAEAASRSEIDAEVANALRTLRAQENTRVLFANAKSVLVFPRILSGGFIVGGQYGQGALVSGDRTLGYYNIAGASFGFTIGAQVAGLAMFFMTDAARAALDAAHGWEIGTGPTGVALDQGLQANLTSTTLSEPVYAISFSQQGLMASLAINGSKITRIQPE
jgi:lipid-binding SYLF domain-containing protein